MRRIPPRLARLATALVVLLTLAAQPARALDIPVSTFTLKNGMRVVVVPDRRAPVVTHMVWYRVGAADEPAGKTGLTHFHEHLMFKGTRKIAPGEFSKIVKRLGGNDNAFTSRDYTAYYQRIARQHLGKVMAMEADRMQNLQLSERDVLTEREVIKEERRERTENNPRALFAERLHATLFTAHPYRRPVVGWMDDATNLTLEDVMAHYRRFYTPANAILVVTGDVSPREVRELAEKHYGNLKNTASIKPRRRTREPAPLAERRLVMRDARVRAPLFQRLYLAPSYRSAGEGHDAHALEVFAEALGGGTTAPLYRELVVKSQLATFAGAFYSGDDRDYGIFGIYATPAPGVSRQKLEAAIDALLKKVLREGLPERRIARARDNLVASATYALDSQFALARIFGAALASDSDVRSVLEWDRRLMQITPKEALAAARKVVRPVNSATGWLLPAHAPQPRRQARTATEAEPASE